MTNGEGGTSVQNCYTTQGIVIIKYNESRSGTLRNCNLKILDDEILDDVMRIDDVMMRAADINRRADDDMMIAHDHLEALCLYFPHFI